MMLSLDTAYRSFGGEVEASSTPTICRLSDSRRHQLSAIAHALSQRYSVLKSSGTSPNFFNTVGSPNAPVSGLQLRQKAIAPALQIFLAIISARTMAADALGHSTASPGKIPSSVNRKGNAT